MFINYIESVLGAATYNTSGNEANFNCPFCTSRGETEDTRGRFRFHVGKLLGYCFNCDWKGNAVTFVRDFNNMSWAESLDVVNFYEEYRPLPQDLYEEVFNQLFIDDIEFEMTKKPISLPKDFIYLADTRSVQARRFRDYAFSRGVSERQVKIHGMGFCPEGIIKMDKDRNYSIKNRLVVQTHGDDNEPIYWVARSLSKNERVKVFNPPVGLNTVNKSDVVFNLNNAKKTGTVVLTEGIFDALTVGDSGVCLFGKTLSVYQLIQILNADLDSVFVMFDPDAIKNALKIAELLSRHLDSVYICDLRDGDPNEVGKRGCLRSIRDAEKYDRFTTMKYKLLGGI